MKATVRSALALVVLALSVVTASSPGVKPEDVGLSSERLQRISQMIARRIAAGEIAGAVTIVARKGKVAHLSAQGVMDLESKQPMTPASMFRIASMTKPVVGVAIMMMVEEGKLHLNDPVSRYIPEFHGMKVGVAQPGTAQPGGGQPGAAGGRGGAEPPLQFYTVPAQREITI
jgi:CubicO group peptidase (beta-lactamase class C family)